MHESFLDIATVIGIVLLIAATIATCIRIVRGRNVADRVVGLDMLGLLGIAAAGLAALVSGSTAFIDVALGIALIGFLTTAAFALFIERGSLRPDPRHEETR